ncbi:MAG: hypothetical protein RMJ66_07110 [Bacteroidia bacterium]|nr:hypothetical protein [Bacteroidia bacterium]MDW8134822.1 hypothetical protein [Bacteroidia bacterium]
MRKFIYFFLYTWLWGQSELSDSLRQLFQKDFGFDIVLVRSFPVQITISDTFPIVPLLSGHMRLGVAWQWRFWRVWGLCLQPSFSWYRQVLRATTASVAPYAEQMPQGYRWLKYRFGAVALHLGVRWQRHLVGELFPRYKVEVGGWLQRHIGSSLKYVAVRETHIERVRWENVSLFHPWQGGAYLIIGRQWLGATIYYNFLSLFPSGLHGGPHGRPYPRLSPWEVGFMISL